MVRPSSCRGDDDIGPVTDRTGRVKGLTVTASSRGVRGQRSTSDLPATPSHLAPGFHHGTSETGSSTQSPAIPFRSRPPLQHHLSHTPVPYEPYGSTQPSSHPQIHTHGYSHAEYGVSSSVPYVPRHAIGYVRLILALRVIGGGNEQERGGSLHIEGVADKRGDGGDDDQDEGDDAGDEEQPVPVASVAHASGSDGRPRHRKGKGLTRSFMSVMSKIAGSHNKRPEVAREVPTPT
ncbi:hypothetical protein M9H77_30039 [Catharanthus roseus]|uniref:Uncharacterized protein n=1 Tax=Catharanthus roseus TaxID=4058 RepID=A0ACB9ZXF8_CATRO|nr:hypothetical protein M9H77_30039 [Catharanthus roseus]